MTNISDILLCGSIKGNIYFVKNTCIGLDEEQINLENNNIKKNQKL